MGFWSVFRGGGVVAIASIVLVFSACGNEPAADSGGGAKSPEELAAVLVTPEDLGEGWTIVAFPDPEASDTSGVVTDADRDRLPRIEFCSEASQEAVDAADTLEWDAFRQVSYATETPTTPPSREPGDKSRPQHHIVFVQEFLMSQDAPAVSTSYDALAAGVEACWGRETTYPDGERGYSESLTIPSIGDDRIGTRDIVKEPGPASQGATWDLRTVMARDGNVLLGITIAEITTPKIEPTLDDATIEGIITTIADKLP